MLVAVPCAAAPSSLAPAVAGATPQPAAGSSAPAEGKGSAKSARKSADPVPEPGALLLFLGAIGGLAVGRVLHPRRRGDGGRR